MTRLGQILACCLLAVGAYFAIQWIKDTEPTAPRVGAVKETAMLVDVVPAQAGNFSPEIVVVGTVEAEREVMLRPRVAGTVIARGPHFTPGDFVGEGDTLLELDPTDFKTAQRARLGEYKQAEAQHAEAQAEAKRIAAELQQVRAERQQAEAELEQAIADRDVEEGRQTIARRDYELLGEKLGEKQRRLALREPQLAAAKAKITAVRTRIASADAKLAATEARIAAAASAIAAAKAKMDVAQAAKDQARNDFERTTIKAPFAAQILERMADRGSEVSPSGAVARLVCVNEYWVIASVPLVKLRWIRFPKDDRPGSTVYVHHETAWGKGRRRVGQVKSLIGTLDRTTRLARVVISIKDPLARTPDPKQPDRPTLVVGSLVEVRIQAETLKDVVKLDRNYLRKGDTVWVKKDGKLEIRKIEVRFEDPEHAYLASGVSGGESIVTTNLSTVAAGAPLRVADEADAGAKGTGKP